MGAKGNGGTFIMSKMKKRCILYYWLETFRPMITKHQIIIVRGPIGDGDLILKSIYR